MAKLCVICGQELEDEEYCSFCEKLLKREHELQRKLRAVDNMIRNRYKYGVEMAKLKEERQEREEFFLVAENKQTEYVERRCDNCNRVCLHRILMSWQRFQMLMCLCCRGVKIERRR